MIEAQQVVWNLTTDERAMVSTPHDKAANQMRALMARLIKTEGASPTDEALWPS